MPRLYRLICRQTFGCGMWGTESAHGPAEEDMETRYPQHLVGRLLDGAVKQLIRHTSLRCPLRAPSATLPDASWPQSSSTVQYSVWDEREVGAFSSIPHSWQSQVLTHTLTFPRGRNHCRKDLCTLWDCLGGGVAQVKSNLSSYPIECLHTHVVLLLFWVFVYLFWFIAPTMCWTSSKALLSICDCFCLR